MDFRAATFRAMMFGVILSATVMYAVPAGNIFDDDWTPPARNVSTSPKSTPPIAAPVTRPDSPPTQPPSPDSVKPIPSPPVDPSALPAAPARAEIPSKNDLATSRQLLNEVYAKELADRSAAARKKLAQKLLDQAAQTSPTPFDQYVMLVGAYKSAMEAGDLDLCFQAADSIARTFTVEALDLKARAVLAIPPAAYASNQNESVMAGIEILDALDTAEDYAGAQRVGTALRQAASDDAALRAIVQKHVKTIEEHRVARDHFARLLEKLATSPNDPAANLSAGIYLCFVKAQWKRGLPMLSKGSDAALKTAADKELATNKGGLVEPEAANTLGDAWWAAAEKLSAPLKPKLQGRAAYWYRQALPGLSGLPLLRTQKRIADVPEDADTHKADEIALQLGHTVNLLPLVNLASDTVIGKWRFQNGAVISDGHGLDKLRLRYKPPQEYDFHVEFTRLTGKFDVAQSLTHAGREFAWVMGAFENHVTILDRIPDQNPTGINVVSVLTNGQKYNAIVKVRRDSVTAYLDGKLLATYADYSALTINPLWSVGPGFLGISSSTSSTSFDVVEVLEISGHGEIVKPEAVKAGQ